MLTGQEDAGAAQSERILLSPSERPGAPPSASEVERAKQLRQDGNAAYAEGRFEEAVQSYSEAALLNPSDHLLYSNRSACWLRMGRPVEALDDADVCVKLAPDFARGFLRKGAAEQLLNRRADAQASYRRGLGCDPESAALLHSLKTLRAESGGGLQATLYHVLFVSPDLQMDRLFQVLEDPDRLTATYVEQHKVELDAQFECLTQTLRVDLGLLLASPVLRDAYDRVTFACGQLLQWAPEAVSRHLCQARRIVEGLGLALRCGWSIHHGVAKFSANALAILATSEGACDDLRREAVRLLLGGMLRWLLDPAPEPENPPEDRDVCGCTFLSPRLSAATWLERLFEHGTRPWVREECERFHGVVPLAVHLCLVVRDERAVPLGLPCLLRLPVVARAVMQSEAVINLCMCNREPAGRRDGRRWFARQRSKAGAAAAQAGQAAIPAASSSASTAPVEGQASSDALADAGAEDAGGAGTQAPPRLLAPSQRLGEWLIASLGYLLVFVDDDALFAAHACSALHRLAMAVPDGVTRLADGCWVGLPMLERLSMLACQHTAALELLESLARHSPPARAAILSLADALAGSALSEEVAQVDVSMEAEKRPSDDALSAASPDGDVDGAESFNGMDVDEVAADAPSAPSDTPDAAPPEREHEGPVEPSWAECYTELHDELWVRWSEPMQERPAPSAEHTLVTLGNFVKAASQVPVIGHLKLAVEPATSCSSGLSVGGTSDGGGPVLEAIAVPAVWNPRLNDAVQGPLTAAVADDLGSPGWQVSKEEGAALLLPRSAIQRSPATPDWATAVWLSADAGAKVVVVVNDLPDDGPSRPAFRMGLFGAAAPPIPAFMVNGEVGAALAHELQKASASAAVRVSVSSVPSGSLPSRHQRASQLLRVQDVTSVGSSAALGVPSGLFAATDNARGLFAGSTEVPPPWPQVVRMPQDVAQAWSLVETIHRAAPSSALADALSGLAWRMGLPEKRVWLTRRLQRHHRGDTDSDEPVEPPLAFVECDRESDQLQQLRRQLAEGTGLGAPDITGEFEVRFKDESSVGSAVVREWMDLLAQKAFLSAANRLLVSYDNGASFLPDPASPFLNPQWQGDFELLGRLLGLALWHQVTLDLPVHPHVCELILHGVKAEASREVDAARLKEVDEELHRHKVAWLLTNDVSSLGFDMPFTDTLVSAPASPSRSEQEATSGTSSSSSADRGSKTAGSTTAEVALAPELPEVVGMSDILPGTQKLLEPAPLRRFRHTQVELASGGANIVVTEANKEEYVTALLDWRLRASLRGPVEAISRGLRAAAPPAVLEEAAQVLSPREVHLLLAGSRDICPHDWERNTRCAGGLSSSTREVKWFWKTVHQWAQEGRQDRLQDLLQFATGSRRVPVGGFAQLVGFNGGKHLFTLARGSHLTAESLPTSHACICTLDLPPWETFEAAQKKLLRATEAGRGRFDEGTNAARGSREEEAR